MTKYEALEKNVVSSRKLLSLRQSLVRSVTQKVSVCWGFWGWSTELKGRLPWSMAEREGFEPPIQSGRQNTIDKGLDCRAAGWLGVSDEDDPGRN